MFDHTIAPKLFAMLPCHLPYRFRGPFLHTWLYSTYRYTQILLNIFSTDILQSPFFHRFRWPWFHRQIYLNTLQRSCPLCPASSFYLMFHHFISHSDAWLFDITLVLLYVFTSNNLHLIYIYILNNIGSTLFFCTWASKQYVVQTNNMWYKQCVATNETMGYSLREWYRWIS